MIIVVSCRDTLAEAAGSKAWVWAAGGTNLRKPRSEARATREHLTARRRSSQAAAMARATLLQDGRVLVAGRL